jgi:hypothetical protein
MPAEYVGHVPLTIGSVVGVVLVESAAPLELPPELLVVPPELPVVPPELPVVPLLDALSATPELPLRSAPPELDAPPGAPPLPEVLDPLEPPDPVPVFRPTPDPPLLPVELPVGLFVEVLVLPVLPPELPPVSVESPGVGPVPPAAQAGADPATPSRTRNMQRDNVPSNRFTERSFREEVGPLG